jgi:phosphoesterase RecJ-like protein
LKRFDVNICRKVSELLLNEVKKIMIITHVNPDGDAMGSASGLNNVFINGGFESNVIVPNDFPEYLGWLVLKEPPLIYEHNVSECHQMIDRSDLLIFLDFNDIERVGKMEKYLCVTSKPLILIDHHPDAVIKADFIFSDIDVSSTAELVYDFIEAIGMLDNLDKTGADALLAGIIADTGSFSHNASRPNMYSIVSDLIKRGADKEKINESLYNNFSEKRMRLLGYCLSEKMEIYPQYRTAMIWLSAEELKRYEFRPGDTEGFVNYPLSVKGVVFSAFFMEKPDHIKISFRSKGLFSTNIFSGSHFNGGGHKNASGGEIKLPMHEALEFFRALLPEYPELLAKDC